MKLENQLLQIRNKQNKNIVEEVKKILSETNKQREIIRNTLRNPKKTTTKATTFKFDLLQSDKIFHIEDIKTLCINYRLRFLDAHFFKGDFPEEAISKIRELEKIHGTNLTEFKIVAPSKLLKLENLDDPLLFASMGNDYFYLIHKWGNDLKWYRRLLVLPFKNSINLLITLLLTSGLLSLLIPIHLFSPTVGIRERITIFVFMFIWITAVVILYGGSKGKNFNDVIWNSKFYNV